MSYIAPSEEHRFADDIYTKVTTFHKKDDAAEQHKHAYDHITVVLGPFRFWIGNEHGVDDNAPYVDIGGEGEEQSIVVAAGIWHWGMARADNVKVMCIFRLHGGDTPDILEEARPLSLRK